MITTTTMRGPTDHDTGTSIIVRESTTTTEIKVIEIETQITTVRGIEIGTEMINPFVTEMQIADPGEMTDRAETERMT